MEKSSGAVYRPWKISDIPELARQINNRRIWDNVRDFLPYPYTEEDARVFIELSSRGAVTHNYAIELDGKVAGGIGVVPGTDVERVRAEIGYWLAEEHWGKGIMSEIVGRFTHEMLSAGRFSNIYAGVFGYNKASMRVLEKAGYRFVGIMHNCATKNGSLTDMHYYEMYL